ncbi:hypothetical protein ACFV29_10210 [Streptomyces sp. NPDC059690]|uniref:hypothetical protein n=1 Tax=Streptomyces sp. NPDC059690 TaxID=3346907 RepID=UPI0036BC1D72
MAVDQLPGQVREFANYLNGLLARLDQRGGWCAVFWQRDPDGMRACLDGREVPPWDVMEALLHDLAGSFGPGTAAPELQRARALHTAALTAYDARPGGRDALSDRLDVMLREQRYAAERQAELGRLLAAATTRQEADALRLDLAWARDDHDRATRRCAELRARTAEADRRAVSERESAPRRGRLPESPAYRADGTSPREPAPPGDTWAVRDAPFTPEASVFDARPFEAPVSNAFEARGSNAGPFEARGSGAGAFEARGKGARASDAGPFEARGSDAGAVEARGSGARAFGARGSDARASEGRAPEARGSGAGVFEARGSDAGAFEVPGSDAGAFEARGSGARGSDARASEARASEARGFDAADRKGHGFEGPAADVSGSGVAAPDAPTSASSTTAPPTPKQRKRRRGSARFAGMVEEVAPVVAPPSAAPAAPGPAVTGGRTPRGARFAGAAEAPERRPEPEVEPLDAAGPREVAEAVGRLVRLRAEGRSGDAHALLVEAAHWPAARFPLLAAELHGAGLGFDWTTLLWEAASLPAGRLVAAADALVAAGRAADGEQILRQGVVRPAAEIGQAVLGLSAEGRRREVVALLDAYVRVRTPEEAARSAEPDPGTLVPLLLEAAHGVSDERHWDLVHALRVAGFTA